MSSNRLSRINTYKPPPVCRSKKRGTWITPPPPPPPPPPEILTDWYAVQNGSYTDVQFHVTPTTTITSITLTTVDTTGQAYYTYTIDGHPDGNYKITFPNGPGIPTTATLSFFAPTGPPLYVLSGPILTEPIWPPWPSTEIDAFAARREDPYTILTFTFTTTIAGPAAIVALFDADDAPVNGQFYIGVTTDPQELAIDNLGLSPTRAVITFFDASTNSHIHQTYICG